MLSVALDHSINLGLRMKEKFDSIDAVITDLVKGKMVIVVDDADRENEGDLIMAAEKVTPQAVNFMARFGRGLVCVPPRASGSSNSASNRW